MQAHLNCLREPVRSPSEYHGGLTFIPESKSMAKNHVTPEQIMAKLREAEVLIARRKAAVQAAKRIGTTEQTYDRWPRSTAA